MIKTGEIVKIFSTKSWIERDFMGNLNLMMQHECDEAPFKFISIHYDYGYTSNAHQHDVMNKIVEMLGLTVTVSK